MIDRHILLVDRGTSLARLPAVRAHLQQFRSALEPRPAEHRGAWHGRKPGPYRWFELQDPVGPLAISRRPRLFYQDIQTAPACCLDATGELVPDTTVWILPSADPVLLAILNSPLYGWYARRRFPPALNGAVRPKLAYMRALPIAEPRPAVRAKIAELVTCQLAAPTPAIDGRDRRPAGSAAKWQRCSIDAELAALVEESYELSARDAARLRER